MPTSPPFERTFAPAGEAPRLSETHLAEVVSVSDNDRQGRVQIRLLSCDGVDGQDGPIWARVATPFAGANRGAFFLPSVGDEVLVSFIGGDPRFPVVVGSLWNGRDAPPETLGGSGDTVDRWTFVGKDGSRVAIVEESAGQATISISTPGGVSALLEQSSGGKLTLEAAGSKIIIEPAGIKLQTSAKVDVQASSVSVTAGTVTVDAALSKFSGVVKCDVMQATTVIATTYTPGAGNVW